MIEFKKTPVDLALFAKVLDETLQSVNSDYEAKRYKDIALGLPIIQNLKPGTFQNWLKCKNKVGGQHKVPRLSNDRDIVEEIIDLDF